MTGKEFRLIDDILNGQFDRDDIFDDKDLDAIQNEEFQNYRKAYLLSKKYLCDFLGYEESATYGK